MSVVEDIVKALHPKVTFAAREEKVSIDLPYRMEELNRIRAKVNWFKREQVKRYVTCIHYGIRRNMTLREITDDANSIGRLPTRIAAAVEVMLRWVDLFCQVNGQRKLAT